MAPEHNLNAFLATSLNTEMVVTILKGICIMAAGSSDIVDHISEQELFKVRQKTLIDVDSITIHNAKQWEDGVQGRTSAPDPRFGDDLMEEIELGASNGRGDASGFKSRFMKTITGIRPFQT